MIQDGWSNDGKRRNETGESILEEDPGDNVRNILGKEKRI